LEVEAWNSEEEVVLRGTRREAVGKVVLVVFVVFVFVVLVVVFVVVELDDRGLLLREVERRWGAVFVVVEEVGARKELRAVVLAEVLVEARAEVNSVVVVVGLKARASGAFNSERVVLF
jgi:hypothetical protein